MVNSDGDGDWISISLNILFILIFLIIYFEWIFKITHGISEYTKNTYGIHYQTNDFLAFIFSIFYINYCINDIDNIVNYNRNTIDNLPQNENTQPKDTKPKNPLFK